MFGYTHQAAGMLKINNESGKTTRRAAFFFMKALDHQLTMIGGGLSTFKVDNLVPLLKPRQNVTSSHANASLMECQHMSHKGKVVCGTQKKRGQLGHPQ